MSTQLTLSEAAKKLKVSEKSIRRYIKAGRMRAVLIKGQKGYEYRIDTNQLKILEKPPRGRNSHRKTFKHINKKTYKQEAHKSDKHKNIKTYKQGVKKNNSQSTKHNQTKKLSTKKTPVRPLESVGEIIKKKIEKRSAPIIQKQEPGTGLVDYKTLYENLLAKYEQTLLMLGSLETQVLNRSNSSNNAKVEKMEDSIAKQEEIIMDLYQTIQLYKNDGGYQSLQI